LLQHPDDLLLREPALPHLLSSSGFYTLENSRLHWYCFRGAGQPAKLNQYLEFCQIEFCQIILSRALML